MGNPKETAASKKNRMDNWLIKLDPSIKANFDAAFDNYEEEIKTASPRDQAAFEAAEDALVQSAEQMAENQGQAPDPNTGGNGRATKPADDQPNDPAGAVKGGVEVEVITKEFPPYEGKYGTITGSCTIKLAISAKAGGDSGFSSSSNVTLKDKKSRTPGIKQGFSDKDIADLKLFDGLSFNDVSVGVEGELSGTEVSVSGTFTFNIVTSAFSAPVSLKLILVKAKMGEGIKAANIELKISPKEFKINVKGIEAKATAEFKVVFEVEWKKIGVDILKKIARKKLEQAAVEKGATVLSREAAELVLRDLGPLAFAFSVGLDIGGLLDDYTAAHQVAADMMETVLGDLNERFEEAGTLGKIWLVYSNKDRILAAMIAAGVAGAAAGIGDLVFFKLLGLDKLVDFGPALEAFKALSAIFSDSSSLASESAFGAVVLAIKLNPKYGKISNPAFAKLGQLAFKKVKPLLKKPGDGLIQIVGLSVADLDLPEADLQTVIRLVIDSKMNYMGVIDFGDPPGSVTDSFLMQPMAGFVGFLEFNKLLSVSVKLPTTFDIEDIDPKLLAEIFG